MTLTKSQKIWLGLLGTGVIALIVDQATTRDHSAMATAIESITAMAGDAPAAAGQRPADPAPASAALSAKLKQFAADGRSPDSVRDAFRPSPAWIEQAMVSSGQRPGSSADDRAARFVRDHVLKAVLRRGKTAQAWVDGSIVEIGQRFDGGRLITADGMTAVFDLGGTNVTLTLPDARNVTGRSMASTTD